MYKVLLIITDKKTKIGNLFVSHQTRETAILSF